MSKRKATTKQTAAKVSPFIQSDNIVIEAACTYTANLAAEEGAYTAHPDANKDFGIDKISDRFHRKSNAAMKVLASTHAHGRDAIEAKARVIGPLVLASGGASARFGAGLSTLETAAVVTFADDVKRFVQSLREIDTTTKPDAA